MSAKTFFEERLTFFFRRSTYTRSSRNMFMSLKVRASTELEHSENHRAQQLRSEGQRDTVLKTFCN